MPEKDQAKDAKAADTQARAADTQAKAADTQAKAADSQAQTADAKVESPQGPGGDAARGTTRAETPGPVPTARQRKDQEDREAGGDFAPIAPSDDDDNPVLVEVPKNAEEIAAEGTALGDAGAEATGGNVPFMEASPEVVEGKRIWALDADHNANLRQGGPGATQPDAVEK